MADTILVIDEGTTSTRSMLFAADGTCLGSEQADLEQYYPRPGWVEHDPEEIWTKSLACARAMVERAGGAERIAGIGITNQRETIIFWSRSSGRALGRAIVWQDRRTADLCTRLKEAGEEAGLQERTGLLLDPYFSASKIAWAMAEWPQLKAAGNDLCIGTIESWLVFRLTGGLHVSDATNASRTALMDIRTGLWDSALVDLFGVPPKSLPEIVDCAGPFGTALPTWLGGAIPICGMAGDQQAAAIGQACFAPGETKATYGTGAFVLTHTGADRPVSRHRLLSTIAWQLGGAKSFAAVEQHEREFIEPKGDAIRAMLPKDKPSLILFDEVLAGLNPSEIRDVVPVIQAIRDAGVTIFLIEHVMQAVMSLAEDVYVLSGGRIIAHGAPEVITRDETVIEAYLGQGAARKLRGRGAR